MPVILVSGVETMVDDGCTVPYRLPRLEISNAAANQGRMFTPGQNRFNSQTQLNACDFDRINVFLSNVPSRPSINFNNRPSTVPSKFIGSISSAIERFINY